MSETTEQPGRTPADQAIERMTAFVKGADSLDAVAQRREEFLSMLDSLSIQRANIEGALLIVLLGGTGVGKSTLINALAGEEVAQVSALRPCTLDTTYYSHRKNNLEPLSSIISKEDRLAIHDAEGLARKILVDPPDFDSMILSNRRKLLEVLRVADVVLVVVDPEKYRNLSLFKLLRRFREGRSFLFLMNKADHGIEDKVVDDFRQALVEGGLDSPRIFLASSREALSARLAGSEPDTAGDFARLEEVILKEIDKAAIERIKNSNLSALLSHAYSTIKLTLPEGLSPGLSSLVGDASRRVRDAAERVTEEVAQALFDENEKIRRFLLSAGSLSMGGIFGLYLAAAEKLSSLFAPRLGSARAQDPMALRAALRKAIEGADQVRIERLVERLGSDTVSELGRLGVVPPGKETRAFTPPAGRTARELLTAADEISLGLVGGFLDQSSSGFLQNAAYNLLPLAYVAYFTYVGVRRMADGKMLDLAFFGTFVLLLLLICFLQHVLAERGFRRRGGRFMRILTDAILERVTATLSERTLPGLQSLVSELEGKVKDFRDVGKLL